MFESCLRNYRSPKLFRASFILLRMTLYTLPVAVTSRLYIATAFSDVAMTLDEERVLPPQLQKPEIISGFFHFAAYDSLYAPSCSYLAPLCRHCFQRLYADYQYDLLKLRGILLRPFMRTRVAPTSRRTAFDISLLGRLNLYQAD